MIGYLKHRYNKQIDKIHKYKEVKGIIQSNVQILCSHYSGLGKY